MTRRNLKRTGPEADARDAAPEPIMDDYDDDYDTRDARSEAASLLSHSADLPPAVAPDKAFRRLVVAMCAVVIFIVEVSLFIMESPLQQIMEGIICRDHYPDHVLSGPGAQDDRCKGTDVQKTLAMVRSWAVAADMAVPLLVQVPYGIVADKYGRRTVLFLSLLGLLFNTMWCMLVLFRSDIFSIWAMLYGSIAYFVGGGAAMATAMVWTILADAVPVVERTAVFYQMHALTLILSIFTKPLSGLLLSIDPWMAMWLGFGILTVGVFSSLLIPETLQLRQMADRQRSSSHVNGQDDDDFVAPTKGNRIQRALLAVGNNVSHMWRFIFASQSVIMLLVAYGLLYPVQINLSINILQYMTKRFSWSWSTATYVSTVSNAASVVALLVILPFASATLGNRFRFDALKRDVLLARASVMLLVVGGFILAFAAAPWLFVSSLIIISMGAGFSSLSRALLNAIIEPHTVATLNTTISTIETFTALLGAPALGWLLSRGLELGGPWLGLTYLVTAGCSSLALLALFAFRLPKGFAQAQASSSA